MSPNFLSFVFVWELRCMIQNFYLWWVDELHYGGYVVALPMSKIQREEE